MGRNTAQLVTTPDVRSDGGVSPLVGDVRPLVPQGSLEGQLTLVTPETPEPLEKEPVEQQAEPKSITSPVVEPSDQEEIRQKLIRKFMQAFAPSIGLDGDKLSVHLDTTSRQKVRNAGASGLAEKGTIFLGDEGFDPSSRRGRYLLGHELAHVAQQSRGLLHSNPDTLITRLAEKEADAVGHAAANKTVPLRPRLRVSPDLVLADTGTTTLEGDVRSRYGRELDRIRDLLAGWLGFLWVTDGMVEDVLQILQSFPFVVAQALIRLLDVDERETLIDEIDDSHFRRFREQILAAYSVMEESILGEKDEHIFDGMDFRGLSDDEAMAVRYAIRGLPQTARDALRQDSEHGEAVRHIMELDQAWDDRQRRRLGRERARQQEEIQSRSARSDRLGRSMRGTAGDEEALDPEFLRDLETIEESISWRMSDEEALAVLDIAGEYLGSPEQFRILAERLDDRNLLDRLVRELPVSDLFENQATGERRTQTLVRLLSVRPAYLNVDIAEDLFNLGLFDWAVTDEDAYLAFQLIRAVPESVREDFEAYLAESDQSLYGEMSQSMRESASLHFYDGGPRRSDTASIQAQLMQEDLWTVRNMTRLEGLLRMAIGAGVGHWVFKQSALAYARDRETYTNPEFYNRIVAPFRLYRPLGRTTGGEFEPRLDYDPRDIEGTHWYEEGPLSFLNMIVQGVQTLARSRSVTLSGHSIGGEDLDISELQDVLGGNLMGIRFSRTGEQREQGVSRDPAVNLIDYARWDQSRGVLEARASSLAIEAVRYPVGGLTLQTQRGRIEGFEVHIVAGDEDLPTALMVSIDTLHLEDLLVITRGSMFGVNQLDINTLDVRMGQTSIRNQMAAPREGGRGWGIPIIGLPLRSLINLITLSGSARELAGGLTAPPSETPVSISIGSVDVSGITTSSGQYIYNMQLGDFSVQMASSAQRLRRILGGHRARLTRLRQDMARAGPDERGSFRQRIQQTELQIRSLQRYFQRLEEAETEADRLTARAEQNPGDVSDADRQRLAFLREMLEQAESGGIVLAAGDLTASGLEGRISAEALTLRDIHGSGQSTEGILNMLIESNALQRMVAGAAHREPVLRSERHLGPGMFTLELGSADVEELTVRSGLPELEDLEQALRLVQQRLSRHPTDLSLRDEERRLERLIRDVRNYNSLTEIGVSEMDTDQLSDFRQLRDRIFSQESFYVHHLTASGLRARVGHPTGGVSLFAEQVDAARPEDGGPGIRAGGATIGEMHGTRVQVRAEIEGGLLAPDQRGGEERRSLRDRVERFGVSGDHLQVLDINHGGSGVSIEEIDLQAFELTNDSIENALDIAARDGRISDIRLVRTPRTVLDGLRQELLNFQSRSEEEQAEVGARIAQLERDIARLRQYMLLMAEVAELAESEADPERQAEADELMQAIAQEYRLWEERLSIGGGRIQQTSVRITGLGNPLREGFSLAAAMEQGITITGTGGEEGQRRMAGSVSATDIGLGPHGRIGAAAAQQLSGRVEIQGDTIRFHDFEIRQTSVSRFAFNTPVGRISSTGRTTFGRIFLSGSIRLTEGDRAVSIQSLRIGPIESGHLRYQHGDLDITLREPPWPEGDEPELRAGEQPETRPPLSIGGIRVNGLEWSQSTGPMPTSGSIRTGAIHGAVNLFWQNIELGAEIDARELNVDFLRGGRAVFLIPELSGRVRGEAMGAEIDTSFHEINTGPVTYDHNRREIDIPDFFIPWIEVNRLMYADSNMEISLPENSGAANIYDVTANLMVALNPSGSEQSLDRIVIRNLYMATMDAWGIEVLLKDINVAGTPRDINLRVPVEEQVTLTGLSLEGNEEDGEGFVIHPPQREGGRWHVFGSLQLESADVSLIRTCIHDLLTVDFGIHARHFMVNLFSVGDYEIDLMNLDLDRIRLEAGDHNVVLDEGEHSSQYTSDAGISIEGFRRERDGVISADNISARGLVYYNEALGIRVDISSFSLPEGARWDTLLPRFVSERVIQLPNIVINEAHITIDDIMRLIGTGGGSGGPPIPWEENYGIFDSINGNIAFDASIAYLPDVHIDLPIAMGLIDYRNLENQLGSYDAILDFRYNNGRLSLVLTNRNINDINDIISEMLPIPVTPPDADADILVWEGLDENERRHAARGQVLISTLVRRYHSMPLISSISSGGGGGGFQLADYLQLQNINASLALVGSHVMNLGPYGHLQLGGAGDAITGLTVSGGVPGMINIGLSEAGVSIPEGRSLNLGPVSVERGSVIVDGLSNTTLGFARDSNSTDTFDGFLPGRLDGTITGARAENLVLSITPAREGRDEADQQSED